MQWYIDGLKKYAVFSGRARRKEYWMYTLFNIIAVVVLFIISHVIGNAIPSAVYALAVLLPSLGVLVRRLHDTGKSGWFVLLVFVPLADIALLVFLCLDGERGQNKYGSDPKQGPGDAASAPQPSY
ncbi:Uncharacterized membrane protein YhaH, DUF805 family [Streptomyces sp. DvalAA-14]|uniref:DUF805 domain-containing protein n=1 Tax=unclassified Streptomyces TaxID=2593676 RepID=UPI00081BAA6D|nr:MULTISPECIES: DUF805 domain-containing protein [unclassified Streptomyces]MYS24240.1 DUF805 domain-containing protein [Streptomyces sp. SID4948]SCE44117.1 Uncharacterized membrane protein YhaH, DUF805 family [Streptomyces sp. DvalAA-14]